MPRTFINIVGIETVRREIEQAWEERRREVEDAESSSIITIPLPEYIPPISTDDLDMDEEWDLDEETEEEEEYTLYPIGTRVFIHLTSEYYPQAPGIIGRVIDNTRAGFYPETYCYDVEFENGATNCYRPIDLYVPKEKEKEEYNQCCSSVELIDSEEYPPYIIGECASCGAIHLTNGGLLWDNRA